MLKLPVSQPGDLFDGFDYVRRDVGDRHRLAVWTVVQSGEVSTWPRWCSS